MATEWMPPTPPANGTAIPSLYPEALETSKSPTDPWMYYARRADHPTDPGFIVPKSSTPTYRARFVQHGWRPLDEYGTFIHAQRSWDARGVLFDATVENYRVFFQRGGAAALPVAQVIAYGWHHRPPYQEITFPQLDGLEVPSFECPECNRPPFYDALHLRDHLQIGHRYTRVELVAYAKDAGLSFERRREDRPRTAAGPPPEPPLDLTPTAVVPLRCDDCDFVTGPAVKVPEQSMRMHRRHHHAESPTLVGVS